MLDTTFISDEGTAGKGQTRTERENKKTKKHPEDVREGAGQELEAGPSTPLQRDVPFDGTCWVHTPDTPRLR